MELECFQLCFIADHALTGGTDEIGGDSLSFLDPSLDDFQNITGEGPNSAAYTTFTGILGESFGMKVNFHMVSALT
jgi:hypothetical protein